MSAILDDWIADANVHYTARSFGVDADVSDLYDGSRVRDFYFSLVGELFDFLGTHPGEREEWSKLGNAIAMAGRHLPVELQADAAMYAATAFYAGGYPASALTIARSIENIDQISPGFRASFDLLARPETARSAEVAALVDALRAGDAGVLDRALVASDLARETTLRSGPNEWVAAELHHVLLERLVASNVRAVLPDGWSQRWSPLVSSLLDRPRSAVWEFFPSQIEAIDAGLLTSDATYSLQMPTGSGKTALTETLIFDHLTSTAEARAVLLVPYRALARELRETLGRRLSRLGFPTRAVYGGTVPTPEEAANVESIRLFIATPEAFGGLLTVSPQLTDEVSLLICDEGHLLDAEARGVGLELLLARFRARTTPPRFVFVSAIVPNVEEINTWLGGSPETVVRSSYQPAVAEYAVLRPTGTGRNLTVDIALVSPGDGTQDRRVPGFLTATDFEYVNPDTRRRKTYKFDTVKAQAVASARRALILGPVAVFASTKTGHQGVVGLAREVVDQLDAGLQLPRPVDHSTDADTLARAASYLREEFGPDWVGSAAMSHGVALHHGDVPQETRELIEDLVANRAAPMVMCTSTLAEGVNLPIRTLVLYSVRRSKGAESRPTPILARDIKNLVGRAGRPGSATRGLVICANPSQWRDIRPVAAGESGEPVGGALRHLLAGLERALREGRAALSNRSLEGAADWLPLVDGIDATLVELSREELGDIEFRRIAMEIAEETFAAQSASAAQRDLLSKVFGLRAARIRELETTGKLGWVSRNGVQPRMVDPIQTLYAGFQGWHLPAAPDDPQFLAALIAWAYTRPDFLQALAEAPPALHRQQLFQELVIAWLQGATYRSISEQLGLTVDQTLKALNGLVSYSFGSLVEQAVAMIVVLAELEGTPIPDAVRRFPEYLRRGVSTPEALALLLSGVRHRRAAVAIGARIRIPDNPFMHLVDVAREVLKTDPELKHQLADIVYDRTLRDLGG